MLLIVSQFIDSFMKEEKESLDEKYSRIWNADAVLDYVEYLADIKITGHVRINDIKEVGYLSIMKKRLDSVLMAYGRYWCRGGIGLMGKMSEDKQNELFHLINNHTYVEGSDKMISHIREAQKLFHGYDIKLIDQDSIYRVNSFFSYILYLYVSIKRLINPFNNMIECSKEVYEVYNLISNALLSAQKESADRLKKMLILMMGDDFDNQIGEVELIERYGYPQITDEELWEKHISEM